MSGMRHQNGAEPSPVQKERVSVLREIRVLLADDNPEMIAVLREFLEPVFEVVGAVNDGDSVIREASLLSPDVIILDISLGEPDGITVARRLQEASCHYKVVFLSIHEISELIRSALAAGGAAYVFKSRLKTDLIPAIHAVCSGRLFVSCPDA